MLTFKLLIKPGPVLLIFILQLLIGYACHSTLPPANRVIVVQPFADLPVSQANIVYEMLKKINPGAVLRKTIPLPTTAYYPQRNRHRADSIINYLNQFASADTVIIGLTSKDISTTKGDISDWGVMGLGFELGSACVVSTFRLSKLKLSDQLFKLALHELGHT